MTHGFGVDARNYKHGHKPASSASPEYVCWLAMKAKCNKPNGWGFEHYGKVGIKICPEWDNSFETFLAYMGARPSPIHSLDRYPNRSGNYEPGNVRWATDQQQANNRKSNRILTHNGETHTMAEWARICGIKISTLHARISYQGWTLERALSQAVKS